MTTLACTIDATGISAPTLPAIYAGLVAAYRGIYGSDVYLDPDSQDGQWIAIVTAAINDCNAVAVGVYNQASPATAQGAGLSSVVKINGITRGIPTASTVTLTVVGQAGVVITNGQARDRQGQLWALPSSVTIPSAGQIDVTATATVVGALEAPIGTVTGIATPTFGWQTVTNAAPALPGSPVESDAALRRRQAISTAITASSPVDAIAGAVAAVTGVTRSVAYENKTAVTDANGVPGHSIAVVALGGADTDIAAAILATKTPGTGTYGTSSAVVYDSRGLPNSEQFFRPSVVTVDVTVAVVPIAGWVPATSAAIQAAITAYLNGLNINDDVFISRLYPPAQLTLPGVYDPRAATFHVSSITVGRNGGAQSPADLVLAFNELGQAGTITVTTP